MVAAGLVWVSLRPATIPVETAKAVQGPMRVTVDEDGETRAHDRFVVAAPILGRMLRINLEEGDHVRKDQLVATIQPVPLNQQQRAEVLARVESAEAAQRQADAREQHAREDYGQSKRDLARAEQLGREQVIATQVLEQARNAAVTSAQELEAAKFSALAAASDVNVAKAGLLGIEASGHDAISLRSPVEGTVLRVVEKSERVVPAGAPLVIVGDPKRIEIVVDVLTTDAVNIKSGAPVIVQGWGGDRSLRASVRLVEPAGFTKISALGVEEKRVNVIADFIEPPDGLSDGYRVDAGIVTWETNQVLKVPSSAPYRDQEGWSVFVVEGGKARRYSVRIGHRNQLETEILGGIKAGDLVVVHPPNQLRDGIRVQIR
jgi:HlyD family secretion protein